MEQSEADRQKLVPKTKRKQKDGASVVKTRTKITTKSTPTDADDKALKLPVRVVKRNKGNKAAYILAKDLQYVVFCSEHACGEIYIDAAEYIKKQINEGVIKTASQAKAHLAAYIEGYDVE